MVDQTKETVNPVTPQDDASEAPTAEKTQEAAVDTPAETTVTEEKPQKEAKEVKEEPAKAEEEVKEVKAKEARSPFEVTMVTTVLKTKIKSLLATGIANLPKGILTDHKLFEYFQSKGLHVLPVHFYMPIPNTAELPAELWKNHSKMVGVEKNLGAYFSRAPKASRASGPKATSTCSHISASTYDTSSAWIRSASTRDRSITAPSPSRA